MTKLRFLAILMVLVLSFGIVASAATHTDKVPLTVLDQHSSFDPGGPTLMPGVLHNDMVVGDEYVMQMPNAFKSLSELEFKFDKSFFDFSYDYKTGIAVFVPKKAGETEIRFSTPYIDGYWYHTVRITDVARMNPPTGI